MTKELFELNQVLRILFLELELTRGPFFLPWLSILIVQPLTSLLEQSTLAFFSKPRVSLISNRTDNGLGRGGFVLA